MTEFSFSLLSGNEPLSPNVEHWLLFSFPDTSEKLLLKTIAVDNEFVISLQ